MTTRRDLQVMEALPAAVDGSDPDITFSDFMAAVESGEAHDDGSMAEICRQLKATEAHCFAVLMTLGGRWPWREEARR